MLKKITFLALLILTFMAAAAVIFLAFKMYGDNPFYGVCDADYGEIYLDEDYCFEKSFNYVHSIHTLPNVKIPHDMSVSMPIQFYDFYETFSSPLETRISFYVKLRHKKLDDLTESRREKGSSASFGISFITGFPRSAESHLNGPIYRQIDETNSLFILKDFLNRLTVYVPKNYQKEYFRFECVHACILTRGIAHRVRYTVSFPESWKEDYKDIIRLMDDIAMNVVINGLDEVDTSI